MPKVEVGTPKEVADGSNFRIAGIVGRMLMESMNKLVLIVTGLVGCTIVGARAENKVDFAMDIQPILKNSCVKCHRPEKTKGKLRLDTRETAFKGGEEGPIIVPGKADKSELYRRITLPEDDDDVMPNRGKLLTRAQTDLIRDWINQGAEWPAGLVIATESKEAETIAATSIKKFPEYKPTSVELNAIKQLESLGVSVRPIAINMNWRETNLRAQDLKMVEKALVPLGKVSGLVQLNLGSTKIKDADLANLEGLTNLQRLHLENTPITDAGLVHLKGLTKLEYLNLYGTAVTDTGLEQLKGLTQLRKLFLWQTKTTEAGVANLKQALPQVDISTGVEFKQIAEQTEKPSEDKDAKK
jgi:Leucine-rich repeat (LRR) protein